MFEKSSISDLNSGLNTLDLTQGKKSTISGNYFPDIVLYILLRAQAEQTMTHSKKQKQRDKK